MTFTFTTEEAEAYIAEHMPVSYISTFRHIDRFQNPEPFDMRQAA